MLLIYIFLILLSIVFLITVIGKAFKGEIIDAIFYIVFCFFAFVYGAGGLLSVYEETDGFKVDTKEVKQQCNPISKKVISNEYIVNCEDGSENKIKKSEFENLTVPYEGQEFENKKAVNKEVSSLELAGDTIVTIIIVLNILGGIHLLVRRFF